jgi:hypothetical protein
MFLRSCGQKLIRAPAALMLCNSHNVRACVVLVTRYACPLFFWFLGFFDGAMAHSRTGPQAHHPSALREAHRQRCQDRQGD